MEKRTADKARKWENELAVIRQRKQKSSQFVKPVEYLPKQNRETSYQYSARSINFERLLLYFFLGIIACIGVWKGFEIFEERYFIDEMKQASQALITDIDSEIEQQIRQITVNQHKSTSRPEIHNPYQIITKDRLIGSIFSTTSFTKKSSC